MTILMSIFLILYFCEICLPVYMEIKHTMQCNLRKPRSQQEQKPSYVPITMTMWIIETTNAPLKLQIGG